MAKSRVSFVRSALTVPARMLPGSQNHSCLVPRCADRSQVAALLLRPGLPAALKEAKSLRCGSFWRVSITSRCSEGGFGAWTL
jgi:hypothetical protein